MGFEQKKRDSSVFFYNRKNARPVSVVIGTFFFFTILVFMFPFRASAAQAGKIIARIGDVEINETYLESVLERYLPEGTFHPDLAKEKKDKFRRDAIKDIIEIELLYHEALERGIGVSEKEVQSVVQRNIDSMGSEAKLLEALKTNGLTMATFKERIRKYEMVSRVLKEISRESSYSDEELQRYYEVNKKKFRRPESLHLFSVLIKVEPTAPEEDWQKKKKEATELLERIRKGEDFSTIASRYSDDASRIKGGDHGFIHRGRLTPSELDDRAFVLKQGEVSDVIRTIHGYHILKAGEKRPGELLSFEAIKGKLASDLVMKRFEDNKEGILEKWRKRYPVEIFITFDGKDQEH